MKFGTDGVRGVAGLDLTTEFAHRLARAAARVLAPAESAGPAMVVIGGDTRESTPGFVAALAAGFAAEGLTVEDLGVVPTPVVAYEAQRLGALGAMVSASHNPYRDNGIKLFAAGGSKLNDDLQTRIEHELEAIASMPAPPPAPSSALVDSSASRVAYRGHVLAQLEERRLDSLRVVLDTAHGAAYDVGPEVLRAAGASVEVLHAAPDGRNINDGCGATDPASLARAVVGSGADLGVALDGDADRLIAVDQRGRIIDGDHIIAICAGDLRERGRLRDDTVVVTVMSNLGFRLAMERDGIHVVETPVGDRYVLEALNVGGFSLGGEQSGHVIFADAATTGDGLLTAVVLLDIVARRGPLAGLADAAMTSLPQVLVNVPLAQRLPDAAQRLADAIEPIERQLGDHGRVLVRSSGTEPLLRIMVEAETSEQAEVAAAALATTASERFA